ncbi:MAG: ABC transporter ATP-binding protein, partial [Deinococcus sp.]|nr:ABC transporter ATP-binding protein [Deinococcus sp.]
MLTVQGLVKHYGPSFSLQQVSLQAEPGAIVAVLGPSGCGKTSLLRLIAGLERPDAGKILLRGLDCTNWPPEQRQIGLVFQDYALFPHLDVSHNIAFGLEMQGASRQDIAQRVGELLELVGLSRLARRRIQSLSGGERQRVALARSLAPRPQVLLLDEPLSSLDQQLRQELRLELRAILKALGVTALYVTHDQEEGFTVADHALMMRAGRVEQSGTPEELYRRPRNAFVARFLGFGNVFQGRVDDQVLCWGPGPIPLPGPAAPGPTAFLVRDEGIVLGKNSRPLPQFRVLVASRLFSGRLVRLELRCGDQVLTCQRRPEE